MAPFCADNICKNSPPEPKELFPDLQVLPRPEPDPAMKDDHDAWLQEYDQWRALRCACGRGYFCREHGSWVSKDDIRSGVAATADEQKKGSCPSYHYGGYSGIVTYIGERDALGQ
ncbi:hypothetical protein ONZ43_g1345 [Nemania bipapillata]|uniref:Uncharacterized protein n=1 Tax=Nemania bipapillata TaxID=110536 RepID=A0ACC2J4U8_9PEZI|nr:hypothetical protein ONZ43_g1345 [Nemania bipapillata]